MSDLLDDYHNHLRRMSKSDLQKRLFSLWDDPPDDDKDNRKAMREMMRAQKWGGTTEVARRVMTEIKHPCVIRKPAK